MAKREDDLKIRQAETHQAGISRRDFCLAQLPILALAKYLPIEANASVAGGKGLQAVSFDGIEISGDLARRANQNFDRLESDIYQPPRVFESESAKTWPGDWEGRTVLGLTLISRSTHREARHLEEILRLYPARMNSQGYFGPVLDPTAIDEQQLSGHGWVLRGLCEYYEWKRDERVLAMIDKIVRNLALPTRGQHAVYPVDPAARPHSGGPAGQIAAHIGNWKLSSDIGCDFIFLDGVTHAYKVRGGADLKGLIEEMMARYQEVDLVGIRAQTHATLTAMRALLRQFENTGDARLLKAVEDRYTLYRTQAMTETYANFNWFERPEWSEVCAIIDSFMLAVQLWRHTGRPAYLEDAHLIYFNGIGRGQRNNGGYGVDTCAGAHDPYVKVNAYEAYWCCTMRGGEGNARAIQYAYFSRPAELVLPFFHESRATLKMGEGALTLRQSTGYPYEGQVRVDVITSAVKGPVRVRLAAPSWTKSHRLRLNDKAAPVSVRAGFVELQTPLRAGDKIALDFDLVTTARDTFNPQSIRGYHAFNSGPLVLGYEGESEISLPRDSELIPDGPGSFRVKGRDTRLARINDLNTLKVSDKDPCRRQVLFREA
jgi:hypothetical protein